ncbi:DUF485 domain-containing protein [Lichenicoccus roseus]|uniref:DUF485 domain-containing protein n=2 Tax=Lichenicoccus roseus TaxID=2683649 RepID=A0A5R9J5N2_9PROT|nr:DUF485 domain-containing protein [Lichenicoccus roseus]
MDPSAVAALRRDPDFIALARARSRIGWTLAGLMVVLYFGFVFLVALAPAVLATPVWGVITLGFPLGLLVIVAAVALTAIYVSVANARFDRMQRDIVKRCAPGAGVAPPDLSPAPGLAPYGERLA